jgi:acetylornithine deacetylase/succinyl-diaminopimelate desuccinylase-like protein
MQGEAVELLSSYLKVDTSNPPGNESRAADFFAELFEREGIEYKTWEAAPGRVSLKAVLPGSGEGGAIIFLNHTDVVPADASRWSADPFGGEVRDGFIYGRGALDMKGQGIAELVAMLELKRYGVALKRDLVFLGVADEEAGQGARGMRYLMDNHPDEFQADVVINEGSFFISDFLPGGKPLLAIATAEKGLCSLKLTRKGIPGHASSPSPDNALEMLVEALSRLKAREPHPRVTRTVEMMFAGLANVMPELRPYLATRSEAVLLELLHRARLLDDPMVFPLVHDTISPTGMQSGGDINVIPELAVVQLDTRTLPGRTSEAMKRYVEDNLSDEKIELEYIQRTEPSESPADSEFFSAIEEVVSSNFENGLVVPTLLSGTSDSTVFREKGIPAYGIFPVLIEQDELKGIHGINERVSVENITRAAKIYEELAVRLCT